MVQQSLGSGVLDWVTRAPLVSPPVTVRKDRGILFFVQQPVVPIETANQYAAVLARLATSYGTYETPLEAKWFPGSVGLMFIVAIPNADFNTDVDVQIVLLPKEFKPGSRSNDQITAEILYEDDLIIDVTVPIA